MYNVGAKTLLLFTTLHICHSVNSQGALIIKPISKGVVSLVAKSSVKYEVRILSTSLIKSTSAVLLDQSLSKYGIQPFSIGNSSSYYPNILDKYSSNTELISEFQEKLKFKYPIKITGEFDKQTIAYAVLDAELNYINGLTKSQFFWPAYSKHSYNLEKIWIYQAGKKQSSKFFYKSKDWNPYKSSFFSTVLYSRDFYYEDFNDFVETIPSLSSSDSKNLISQYHSVIKKNITNQLLMQYAGLYHNKIDGMPNKAFKKAIAEFRNRYKLKGLNLNYIPRKGYYLSQIDFYSYFKRVYRSCEYQLCYESGVTSINVTCNNHNIKISSLGKLNFTISSGGRSYSSNQQNIEDCEDEFLICLGSSQSIAYCGASVSLHPTNIYFTFSNGHQSRQMALN